MNYSNEEYQEYIKEKSPNSKLLRNMLRAFFIGGGICAIGQGVENIYKDFFEFSEESIKVAVPVTMIFLGALFTGLNLYNKFAKIAGAGTLVTVIELCAGAIATILSMPLFNAVLGLITRM